MNLCEKHNLISVLESVVKPNPSTGWKSEIEKLDSMFESADEISKFQPDIYKCEVPGWGKFTKEKLIASSEEISRLIKGDWVVLSNGTAKADFFDSVETTFSAGASGFLAGRAIWAEALESSDSVDFLNDNSLQFFKKLTKIVEKKQQ
jgi:sulfofructosephosphate aldolase